ncbi:MAG: carboxypeptidase M32 [Minwuia sp.]|uniref:carboxypeptidase M32 n=1 Tax=Minwuia sp. TaxID=2493630 RepID=UPI003A891317
MNAAEAYRALEERFRRRARVQDALSILHWDNATLMPAGAADGRTDQIAELTKIAREILLDPATEDLLGEAEADAGAIDGWQARNLELMRREHRLATAIPSDLVEAMQRAGAASEMNWRTARRENDFASQRPHLEKVFGLVREAASVRGAALGLDPYDAQLELFEPGLRDTDIAPVFADLGSWLPEKVAAILERQASAETPSAPEGPFDRAIQKQLGEGLMRALGFDFEQGRLDESMHPFTGGVQDDVRLTTRYTEHGFVEAMMGILHETGHALYEQGLPKAWRGQPVGNSGGMALHESQSLIVEMQLCRGPAFVGHVAPMLAEAFGGQPALDVANISRLVTRVRRGLIRVDADEATYPLHIILRYRLEKALLAGDLAVADLPGAWNDGMADLVGVRPPDDRDGCLQDIHWMDGAVGYFPTYTLGALGAAQLMAAVRRDVPDLDARTEAGDFAAFTGWLREKVHARALSATTGEVIADATGAPLSADAFRTHLDARYLN